MVDDRMSGVELLALYGDDDRIGAFLPGLRKAAGKAVKFTPQYWMYRGGKKVIKKMHGDERIGAFLPGLMKPLRKVGKVTSGFTTAAAQAVGIPKGVITAFSKLDPTSKKPSLTAAVKTVIPVPAKTPVQVKKAALKIDTRKVLIVGGSAVGALIILKLLLGAPRSRY